MKRRCRACPSSRRPSIRFIVAASRAMSAVSAGAGTRRWSSAAEISSTSRRIDSTGASDRPTTAHVVAATTTSSSGRPSVSRSVTTAVDSLTASRVRAAITENRPSSVSASAATARKSSSSAGAETRAEAPGSSSATGGSPATNGLEATTSPSSSTIWMNRSSSSPGWSTATNEGPVAASSAAAVSVARTRAADRTSSVSVSRIATTRAMPPIRSARPTTAVATAVVRTLTVPADSRSRDTHEAPSAIGGQPVAGAADGLDGGAAERPVELVAQAAHVDLDDVGVALEVDVPHVLEDLALRHHVATSAEQELEQGQLPSGQLDLGRPAPGGGGCRAHPQGAALQHGGPLPGPPPPPGPPARHPPPPRKRGGGGV